MPKADVVFLGRRLNLGPKVQSHHWSKIPPGLAVLDYDVAILDFTVGDASDPLEVHNFPSVEQLARASLTRKCALVVVGAPWRELHGAGERVVRADEWLPVKFPIRQAGGELPEQQSTRFVGFAKSVQRYAWFLQADVELRDETIHHYLSLASADRATIDLRPQLRSRRGEPVGFTLELNFYQTAERRYVTTASITWLPTPGDPDDERVWQSLLADLGVELSTPMPEWVSKYLAPRASEALDRWTEAQSAVEAAEQALADCWRTFMHELGPTELLFETGEPLEARVRDAFEALGAQVDPPDDEFTVDIRITAPSGWRAAIEVKGKTKRLSSDDIHQASNYKLMCIENEPDSDWKTIVVLGHYRLKDPAERDAPVSGKAQQRLLEETRVAVLTTYDLFLRVREMQAGTFDSDTFWENLHATAGLVRHPSSDSGNPQ